MGFEDPFHGRGYEHPWNAKPLGSRDAGKCKGLGYVADAAPMRLRARLEVATTENAQARRAAPSWPPAPRLWGMQGSLPLATCLAAKESHAKGTLREHGDCHISIAACLVTFDMP